MKNKKERKRVIEVSNLKTTRIHLKTFGFRNILKPSKLVDQKKKLCLTVEKRCYSKKSR